MQEIDAVANSELFSQNLPIVVTGMAAHKPPLFSASSIPPPSHSYCPAMHDSSATVTKGKHQWRCAAIQEPARQNFSDLGCHPGTRTPKFQQPHAKFHEPHFFVISTLQ